MFLKFGGSQPRAIVVNPILDFGGDETWVKSMAGSGEFSVAPSRSGVCQDKLKQMTMVGIEVFCKLLF